MSEEGPYSEGREVRRVVLFPGAGMVARSYQGLLRRCLPSGRYEVWDRGTGDLEADVAGMAALCAQDPPGSLVVVAHSMGAFAAETFVRRHPEKVAGLVLLDPSAELDLSSPTEDLASLSSFSGRGWAERTPVVRRFLRDFRRYDCDAAAVAALRADSQLPDVPMVVVTALLTQWRSGDRRWQEVQERLVAELAAAHPRGEDGVSWELLVPCGHAVMWWRPAATAQIVRSVLEQPSR
ncbi:alpha/beta fold hydrolase [Austwickia chelonae]|uniref:alpha/beta fold hydrolase n=1 Tax=Austwickia chelonae TaxID=100225 RepID=UPI001F084496|nr:alpha/beta hydrolase [Austwickia chelonae]